MEISLLIFYEKRQSLIDRSRWADQSDYCSEHDMVDRTAKQEHFDSVKILVWFTELARQ